MSYCTNHRRLDNMQIVTTITIPHHLARELETTVIQLMFQYGGKGLYVGITDDGSTQIQALFYDAEKRKEFCQKVNETIDARKPVSLEVIDDESGEKKQALRFNGKFLFAQYPDIREKIVPVIKYIDENGGWVNKENGNFPGFDALEIARANGTAPSDVKESYEFFTRFMVAYLIGNQAIGDGMIVPNRNKK